MASVERDGWMQKLRAGLLPAVPVPMSADGEIHEAAHRRYVAYVAQQRCRGVAVWAHTGRGLHLTPAQREWVLRAWREGLGHDRIIIAGAGVASHQHAHLPLSQRASRCQDEACRMAEQALELGADAILVYPPRAYRGVPAQEELVVEYHRRLASLGAPLIVFYLYENAGGLRYSREVVEELMKIPEVLGIKVATLDSVLTFQDIAGLVRQRFPEKVLLTGEDRMLPYTLMRGAQAALIGMGAALTSMQAELIASYFARDYATFHELADKVDRFAEVTFYEPMEKYIVRMLGALMLLGVISEEAVNDPLGYRLESEEVERLKEGLREIGVMG